MEVRDDIEPLPHWGAQAGGGDLSGHAMCGACRKRWGRDTCPFCRDLIKADEVLGFIGEFTAAVSSGRRDPNTSAALLESLQLFEMAHEAQPQVVARVFKLIAEDAQLEATLRDGLARRGGDWLRDMGGVVFRLHAMAEEGELRGLAPRHAQQLRRAVDAIFAPFEQPEGRSVPALNPHFIGALYMQAVVPWLCAWRGGAKTDVLAATVRRAGHACCRWLKHAQGSRADNRRGARERLHAEYAELCSSPVWGGQGKDPVWSAFLA